jgi:hypothetical protein
MHLLATDLGALDVMGAIGAGLTYQDLLGRTVHISLQKRGFWFSSWEP